MSRIDVFLLRWIFRAALRRAREWEVLRELYRVAREEEAPGLARDRLMDAMEEACSEPAAPSPLTLTDAQRQEVASLVRELMHPGPSHGDPLGLYSLPERLEHLRRRVQELEGRPQ